MSVHTESGPSPESSKPFRKWQCGTPYEYPITPEGKDHWEELLKPLLEEDKVQCESWKDEVDNLLLFAGLFSAVVTAFVIVSYTNLQPDQGEVTNALLARIADRLDNPFNGSSSPAKAVNTVTLASPPNSSSIRINIYWFISLVLSLTTALMGIVAVQWLKHHQTYPASYTSMQRFAIFNMRAEGLRAWYVPQIFSALPVLLQAALALFFLGLVEFLLDSSSTVAIPVIISISFPLAFLVVTTTIPVLQAYVFCLPVGGYGSVPSQAPYKSTQSRLILQLLGWSYTIFKFFVYFSYAIHYYVISLPSRFSQFVKAHREGSTTKLKNNLSTEQTSFNLAVVRDAFTQASWTTFDAKWLTLRSALSVSIFDDVASMSRYHIGMTLNSAHFFDLANGVTISLGSHSTIDEETLALGYAAIQEMIDVINKKCALEGVHVGATYMRHLQALLVRHSSSTYSSFILNPSAGFMEDETKFIFLSRYPADAPPPVLRHFAELHVRIANYLYPRDVFPSVRRDLLRKSPSYPDIHFDFFYVAVSMPESTRLATYTLEGATGDQLSSLIKTSFEIAADPEVDLDAILASPYSHPMLSVFAYATLTQSAEHRSSTLYFISSNIRRSAEGRLNKRSDFLFYFSSFYVRMNLLRLPSYYDRPELSIYVDQPEPLFNDVLAALCKYLEARKTPDADLRKAMEIPDVDHEWWSFLKIGEDEENEQAINDIQETPGDAPSLSSITGITPPPAVSLEARRSKNDTHCWH